MSNWKQSLVNVFFGWRSARRVKQVAKTIAGEVQPDLWESVRRKISGGVKHQTELHDYAHVRATQLTHQRVDAMIRSDPTMSGAFANQVILKASELAVRDVLAAAANAKSGGA